MLVAIKDLFKLITLIWCQKSWIFVFFDNPGLLRLFSIIKDFKIINGFGVLSYANKLNLSIIANQINDNGFYYKTTGIWHKKNPMPRNKDLHFINSTETWIYFTYHSKTSTFNNEGKTIHDFFESSLTPGSEKKNGSRSTVKEYG